MSNFQRFSIANCNRMCSTIEPSSAGEFVKFDDIKELLKLSPNIDYMAALREIKEIMVPGRYTMRRKLQYIDSVISRLNLQPKPCKLHIVE